MRSRCCKGLQKSRRVLLSPATPDNTTISAGGTKTIQVVYQPPITDVSTGRSETEQTLTIQSDISATANITLTDVSVIARDAAAFDADMTDQELTLGESTEIHVTFESSQTGQRVAALSVLTNDPRQPGRVAFLSHTQTVIEIGFGSVTFGFEPDSDELPVLPPGTASVTTENTGRITQVQPAVSATNDFGFTFEENKPDPGPPGNNANPTVTPETLNSRPTATPTATLEPPTPTTTATPTSTPSGIPGFGPVVATTVVITLAVIIRFRRQRERR